MNIMEEDNDITVERSVNRLVLLLPVDEKQHQSY